MSGEQRLPKTSMTSYRNPIEQYEKKLKALHAQRKEIFRNLGSIRKHQRLFQEQWGTNRKHKPEVEEGSQGLIPRKIVKQNQNHKELQSTLSKQQQLELQSPQKSSPSKKHLQFKPTQNAQKQKEDFKKACHLQAQMNDRNRRLFGGLSSYLKKAKSRIDTQGDKIKQKMEMEEKVRQKERSQNEEMREVKKKDLQDQHELSEKGRHSNARQILKYQNLILRTKYANYVNQLRPFLMTKTEPKLAWRPAKDSQTIQKLKANTISQLETQEKEVGGRIEQFDEAFDLGKFIRQNEQQYYKNKIERYYQNKKNFLQTKTKPALLWRPGKFNDALKKEQQRIREIYAQVKLIRDQEKNNILQEFMKSYLEQREEENENHHEQHLEEHSQSENQHSDHKG